VSFAPTPEEEQLRALAATLRSLLLLLIFWPLVIPWRLLLLGERLTAKALGVYLGLLQASSLHSCGALDAGIGCMIGPPDG
jgi:hypothetical protein